MASAFGVLIVEDDPILALDISSTVTRAGWSVLATASNGEAAILLIAKGARPAVVLLDINLGRGIDGITTAEGIRDHDDKMVMMFHTAQTDQETQARAQRVQPFAFIDKVASPRALLQALANLSRERGHAPIVTH